MPQTPIYQYPYPGLGDPPHGPNQLQALAEALDSETARVDSDITNRNSRSLGGRLVTTPGEINISIGATETDIAKLAIENTAVTAGRWYIFNVKLSVQFSTVDASFAVRVRKDTPVTGPVVATNEWISQVVNFTHTVTFELPWKALLSDLDADFYVSLQRVGGSGTCDLNGGRVTAFWIDEILNPTGWQEVP